jgi:hypothetical protein
MKPGQDCGDLSRMWADSARAVDRIDRYSNYTEGFKHLDEEDL